MNHVRIYGDPFGEGPEARELRGALRYLQECGLHVALSLPADERTCGAVGGRLVEVSDGRRSRVVATDLDVAEVQTIVAASQRGAVTTAPLLVFASDRAREETLRAASTDWPLACATVLAGGGKALPELRDRVRAELRWAGLERRARACSEQQLRPWLRLPAGPSTCFVHVSRDLFDAGTDLVVETFASRFAAPDARLRLVLSDVDPVAEAALLAGAGDAARHLEVVRGPATPEHFSDAAAVIQPYRRCASPRDLIFALASGRPVVTPRFADTADVLSCDGVAFVFGGGCVVGGEQRGRHFVADADSFAAAWSDATREEEASATGVRARRHVCTELLDRRPFPPPPSVRPLDRQRPVVLEPGAAAAFDPRRVAVAAPLRALAADEEGARRSETPWGDHATLHPAG